MGGFLGIGGSSAKTDRSNQLTSFSNLKSSFNWAFPQAQSSTSAGMSSLGAAGQYFQNILSGSRNKIAQAVAPETKMARSASDASARQLATSGTARGGGVAATNQQRDQQLRQTVDNAIFGARSNAAQGAAQVGASEAQIGTQQGMLGEYAASDLGKVSTEARKTDLQLQEQIGGGVAKLLMGGLSIAATIASGGAAAPVLAAGFGASTGLGADSGVAYS